MKQTNRVTFFLSLSSNNVTVSFLVKVCFHRKAKDANVEKLQSPHSYFRLQKCAKHARGLGSIINCSQDDENIHKKFQILCKNSCGTKHDNGQTPAHVGELLEPKI